MFAVTAFSCAISDCGQSDAYTPGKTIKSADVERIEAYLKANPAVRDAIGQQKWFFTHASVGQNMMDGMNRLNDGDTWKLSCTSHNSGTPPETLQSTIYDWHRDNPAYNVKVAYFNDNVQSWVDKGVTAAMNKFCWIDIDKGHGGAHFGTHLTNAAKVANAKAFANLMLDSAQRFSTIAVPLMTIPLEHNDPHNNYYRLIFNNELRSQCASKGLYLLDLADIECNYYNGTKYDKCTQSYNPGSGDVLVEALCDQYGCGGQDSHLNVAGEERAAKGWYALAAAIALKGAPGPSVSISGPASIMKGMSATLTASVTPSGTYTYSWEPGGQTSAEIFVSPAATTTYTVTAVSGSTQLTKTHTVEVVIPVVTLSGAGSYVQGDSATLRATTNIPNPTFAWERYQSGSWGAISETGSTLTIDTSAAGSQTYRAKVGTVESGSGTVDVAALTAAIKIDNEVVLSEKYLEKGKAVQLQAVTNKASASSIWTIGTDTYNRTSFSRAFTQDATVSLEVKNGGISATAEVSVKVFERPTITIGDKKILNGQTVVLNPTVTGTNLTYAWTQGGSPLGTDPTQSVSPTATTVYTLKVTSNGITATKNITVTVSEFDATISATPNGFIEGDTVTLKVTVPATDVGGYTYKWTKAGAVVAGETNDTLSVTASACAYSVEVKNGTLTKTAAFEMAPAPFRASVAESTGAASPKTIDEGDRINLTVTVQGKNPNEYSLSWSKVGGGAWTSTEASINDCPSARTVYAVTITLTADQSKSATIQYVVNVTPLRVNLSASSSSVYTGESVTLTATTSKNVPVSWYKMSGATEATLAGATGKVHTTSPTETTTYRVKISNGGASASADVTVSVGPRPVPETMKMSVTPNITIAKGESATLTATVTPPQGVSYEWKCNGAVVGSFSSITVSPAATSVYTVKAIRGDSVKTASVTVTVTTADDTYAKITGVTDVDKGKSTTLTATFTGTGDCTYAWSNGDTAKSITVSPETTSEYSVTVRCGGKDYNASATVTVYTPKVVETGNADVKVEASAADGVTVKVTREVTLPADSEAGKTVEKAKNDGRMLICVKLSFENAAGKAVNGEIKITMAVEGCTDGEKLMVMHIRNDGSYELIPAIVENGKISVIVTSFSVFAVYRAAPEEGGNTDYMWIVAAALIIVFVASVLFLRRKKTV